MSSPILRVLGLPGLGFRVWGGLDFALHQNACPCIRFESMALWSHAAPLKRIQELRVGGSAQGWFRVMGYLTIIVIGGHGISYNHSCRVLFGCAGLGFENLGFRV